MPAVKDFLARFNPWHHNKRTLAMRLTSAAVVTPPPITPRTAAVLLVLYALIYFLPFYTSQLTRPSPTLSRDAPSVIRARITSVLVSCFFACLATYLILVNEAKAGVDDALHFMGIWPVAVVDSLRALLLTALLFLGPLFSYLVVDRGYREWLRLDPLKEVWAEWTTWRNIVAGPVTEEILYRSASIPLMLIARTPIKLTIFLSPLIFGLSHVHHFYEFRLTHPKVPVAAALARSIFQFTYTTLFGAYATFLYVRTGSLLAVCLVHAFCNSMGLPQLWGRVQPIPPVDLAASGAPTRGKEDEQPNQQQQSPARRRTTPGSLGWTVAYYSLLVIGAIAWYRSLWLLTESENALVPTEAFFKAAKKAAKL
ncbi:Abi-domain-containing protein [Thozetella sp. PMI_491]|nr:Abi-domain-containing protein [Thozetella sp. PMI_491]